MSASSTDPGIPTPIPFPEPPSPPTPGEPPAWTPAQPQRPRRRGWPIIIGSVLAVALLVLVLGFTGVLPFFSHGNPSALTFYQARSDAQPAVGSTPDGPWTIVFGAGLDLSSGLTYNLTSALGGSCTLQPIGGGTVPTSIAVPGFGGAFSGGISPFWVLGYRNTTNAVLVVTVANGSPHVEGVVPSTSACAVVFAFLGAVDSGVIDSSVAANTAMAVGGTAFLSAHQNVSMTMALIGGLSVFGLTRPATWTFSMTTCPPLGVVNGTLTSHPTFNATINAQTGDLISTANSTTTCAVAGASIPLASSIALGAPTESVTGSGTHWYNFSVTLAGNGLRFANFTPEVATATGLLVTLPAGSVMDAVSITGSITAQYSFATAAWTPGASAAVSAGYVLALDTGTTSVSGDSLKLVGLGNFTGVVTRAIP